MVETKIFIPQTSLAAQVSGSRLFMPGLVVSGGSLPVTAQKNIFSLAMDEWMNAVAVPPELLIKRGGAVSPLNMALYLDDSPAVLGDGNKVTVKKPVIAASMIRSSLDELEKAGLDRDRLLEVDSLVESRDTKGAADLLKQIADEAEATGNWEGAIRALTLELRARPIDTDQTEQILGRINSIVEKVTASEKHLPALALAYYLKAVALFSTHREGDSSFAIYNISKAISIYLSLEMYEVAGDIYLFLARQGGGTNDAKFVRFESALQYYYLAGAHEKRSAAVVEHAQFIASEYNRIQIAAEMIENVIDLIQDVNRLFEAYSVLTRLNIMEGNYLKAHADFEKMIKFAQSVTLDRQHVLMEIFNRGIYLATQTLDHSGIQTDDSLRTAHETADPYFFALQSAKELLISARYELDTIEIIDLLQILDNREDAEEHLSLRYSHKIDYAVERRRVNILLGDYVKEIAVQSEPENRELAAANFTDAGRHYEAGGDLSGASEMYERARLIYAAVSKPEKVEDANNAIRQVEAKIAAGKSKGPIWRNEIATKLKELVEDLSDNRAIIELIKVISWATGLTPSGIVASLHSGAFPDLIKPKLAAIGVELSDDDEKNILSAFARLTLSRLSGGKGPNL